MDDRLAVDDLLTRYAVAIDTQDWGLLGLVFSADATVDYAGAGGPTGSAAELAAWLEAAAESAPMTQHFVVNRSVQLEGDAGEAHSYLLVVAGPRGAGPVAPAAMAGGHFRDRVARTADGWRITSRTAALAWVQGHVAHDR